MKPGSAFAFGAFAAMPASRCLMFGRGILFAAAALILAAPSPARAQAEPGPAGACVNAVFDAMRGTWGTDTPSFDPNRLPAEAWQIMREDSEIMLLMTMGQVHAWFLTEHGADFVRESADGFEGVHNATRLLACQQPATDAPAMLESIILIGAAPAVLARERIEVTPDTLTITRWAPTGQLTSERRMRRYNPPPAPPRPR